MTVTLAFKGFAKAIPCSTPFLATSDPSVLKRILAYIRGLPCSSNISLKLFDHLVGAGEQVGRHRKAKCLGGFEIDGEFEPGRLHNREVCGTDTLQHAPRVTTDLVPSLWAADIIAHQPAGLDELAPFIHGRHRMVRCQGDKLIENDLVK